MGTQSTHTHGQLGNQQHVQAYREDSQEDGGRHEPHTPDERQPRSKSFLAITVDEQTDNLPDICRIGETGLVVCRDDKFLMRYHAKTVQEGWKTKEGIYL